MENLRSLEKHTFNFCKLKNAQKNMNIIFFASYKISENVNVIFCKPKTSQKRWIGFFKLKNLKNMKFTFCKPKKLKDNQIFIAVRRDLKTSLSTRLSVTPVNEAMIAKLISSTLSYHPKNLTITLFDNELDARDLN